MATNLTIPNLDDRRWVDLVEEARALIPLHAPGWTDHNAHDPGISIVELLAWIAEMDLYALNQVTDAHRRKLLALVGARPYPPRPAETVLAISLAAGAPPVELPAGAEFEGLDRFGGSTRWCARHDVVVQPGVLAAVLSTDAGGSRDLTDAWRRGEPLLPFGPDPRPGAAFYLGFELPAPWPAGTELSIGLVPAAADGSSDHAARTRIGAEAPPASRHHSVTIRWELLTALDEWTELEPGTDADDDTRALTLDGRLRVRTPAATTVAVIGRSGSLAWLRATIVRGAYDAAPVLRGLALNAVEIVQAVPAVTRLRLAAGASIVGPAPEPGSWVGLDLELDAHDDVVRLDFLPVTDGAPAVRIIELEIGGGHLTVEAAAIVRGTGGPSQRLDIAWPPLIEESVRLFELTGGAWREWACRPDFDASGRADAHFVTDPTEGTIMLGDGERGRAARSGAVLLVTGEISSAAAGNLAKGAIDRLAGSPRNRALVADLASVADQLAVISNVVAATGGTAAESVPAAIARVREAHLHATRAVAPDDYVTLAMETPGTRLARVEVRPNLHPGFPCVTAPGVVTVLILPSLPVDLPAPSAGLRNAVSRHLAPRRVIGTRVEVVGPTYTTVVVRCVVATDAAAAAADVQAAIRASLDAFFDPLTGGPSGAGWPFGRDVYRAEVLALIDGTTGVAHVLELELVDEHGLASCSNLCVGPLGLVASGQHEITVR